jgi:hypothetical protein
MKMTDEQALAVLEALHPVCPKPIRDYIAARLSAAPPADSAGDAEAMAGMVDRYLSLTMRQLGEATEELQDASLDECENLWWRMTQDQRDEANRIVSTAIHGFTPADSAGVTEAIDDVLRALRPTPDVCGGAEQYGFTRGVEAARAAVKKAISAARGK